MNTFLRLFLISSIITIGCTSNVPRAPRRVPDACAGVDTRVYQRDKSGMEPITRLLQSYRLRTATRTMPLVVAGEGATTSQDRQDALAIVHNRRLACQRLPKVGSALHLAVLMNEDAAMEALDTPGLMVHRAPVSEEVLFGAAPRLRNLRGIIGKSDPGTIDGVPVVLVAVLRASVAKAVGFKGPLARISPHDRVWSGVTPVHLAAFLHQEFAEKVITDPEARALRARGFGGVTVAHLAVFHHGVAGYALYHPDVLGLRATRWLALEGCTVAHAIAVLYPRETLDFLKFYPQVGTLEARAKGKKVTVLQVATEMAKDAEGTDAPIVL